MTRLILTLGAVILGLATTALGQPTTAPAATTRQLIVEQPGSYSSVLVLPFTPVAGASEWIGKGIQEDLATELVRQSRLNVLTPPNAGPASDATDAARIGRERNVTLVIYGSYQIVDPQVRINGEVVDVNAGRAIAALKATGPRRDLFNMEDVLAAQTVAAIPPNLVKVGAGAYASDVNNGAAAPSANNSAEPYNSQGYYVTPGPSLAPTYDYGSYPATPVVPYDNGYDYAYPPYSPGYDYPFWNSGFIFLGGFGGFGHGHDHDGHGHGGHGTWDRGGGFTHSPGGFGGGFHGSVGGFHGGGGGHR